jgi:hypothetical protein
VTAAESDGQASRGKRIWGVLALVKLIVLFGAVYFLIKSGVVEPLALTAGLGVLPIGIAIRSLLRDTTAAT